MINSNDLHNVYLVGHSLAGVWMQQLLQQIGDRLGGLVFVDAVALETGESFFTNGVAGIVPEYSDPPNSVSLRPGPSPDSYPDSRPAMHALGYLSICERLSLKWASLIKALPVLCPSTPTRPTQQASARPPPLVHHPASNARMPHGPSLLSCLSAPARDPPYAGRATSRAELPSPARHACALHPLRDACPPARGPSDAHV